MSVMVITLIVLGILSVLIGLGFVIIALTEKIPVKWMYYHYFVRKPFCGVVLIITIVWLFIYFIESNSPNYLYLLLAILPIGGIILAIKLHAEYAFKAVDFPEFEEGSATTKIPGHLEIAVVEYEGVTKCYPLDYVIHHHIINDHFNERVVSLTYCALCRSIIPFDVTEFGPLFVSGMKGSNMLVADRKTKTFFQQATFKSLIGKLHPTELSMLNFQTLTWDEVKATIKTPHVVKTTAKDFKEFELPIPGVWKKVMASEFTPGLKSKKSPIPKRTRIIGVLDKSVKKSVYFLKSEIPESKIIRISEYDFFIVKINNVVRAFRSLSDELSNQLQLREGKIYDPNLDLEWNLLGKSYAPSNCEDLISVQLSDEYWFSWDKYHSNSTKIKLDEIYSKSE